MTSRGAREAIRSRKRIGRLLLSSEHGGNRVPATYAKLFAGPRAQSALASHRGSDLGSLELARNLARKLDAPLLAVTVTRLLIELNRSRSHPALFSEFSRNLDCAAKARLIDRYYVPHRERVHAAIESARGLVCHISVHSFAPVLAGESRPADIGLLYDPARPSETRFCSALKRELQAIDPALRVRRNYPYLGKSDGLTTALRKRYPGTRYLGIELEVNQALLTGDTAIRQRLAGIIAASLGQLLRSGF